MNTLGDAGAAYLVTGDARYLAILKNAYDYLQANRFSPPAVTGRTNNCSRAIVAGHVGRHPELCEIQCGTWAAFKMVKYLVCCTGNGRYGDWAERLAINGIGAGTHTTAEAGCSTTPTTIPAAARKRNYDRGWSCCTGTRPQAVADYCDLVYFKDRDNLYVNLFAPSTVRWSRDSASVTVQQTTRFPEEDAVAFTFQADRPVKFGLKIRTPLWLARPMTAQLNGEPVSLEVDTTHWATLRREWRSGYRLSIILPMRLWVSRLVPTRSIPRRSSTDRSSWRPVPRIPASPPRSIWTARP